MTDEEHSDSRTEDDYELAEAYDDEGTLDEEEMLHPEEDYQEELKLLQDDANLPVEELRERYCNADAAATAADDDDDDDEEYDDTLSPSTSDDARKSEETDDLTANPDASEPDMDGTTSPSPQKRKREHGYFSDVDDNEEDADYEPPDQKRVRQGPTFQASVPYSPPASPKSPREERETLLWTPYTKLSMKKVEEYLKDYYDRAAQSTDPSFSGDLRKVGNANRNFPLKDDEDALKALLDANFNTNVALADYPFHRANAPVKSAPANSARWTDQDCDLFERGMEMHGKNFYAIKQLLPHRTVGEIVHFYYIWKKTERHDMYEERIRGAKNQMHPNCTDFMGGLVDHMSNASGGNVLDIAPNAIPANVDLLASREWRECWQNTEGGTLPHLDSDTIANVLQ